jgi:hypothetical protein
MPVCGPGALPRYPPPDDRCDLGPIAKPFRFDVVSTADLDATAYCRWPICHGLSGFGNASSPAAWRMHGVRQPRLALWPAQACCSAGNVHGVLA